MMTESQLEDISEVPVQELVVETKNLNPKSVVETPEFRKALAEILSNGKVWRTSTTLAEKLGVDTKDLDGFLRKQPSVVSKAAKEEGVFLYRLIRDCQRKKKINKCREFWCQKMIGMPTLH